MREGCGMIALILIWVGAGFCGWLWIMTRYDMADDALSWIAAFLMIFPACVAGPLVWIAISTTPLPPKKKP